MSEGNTYILDLGGETNLELVHIPSGSFLLGSNKKIDKQAGKDEQPQHSINLDEFWIGKFPVTNSQYRRFLGENRNAPPEDWMNADNIPDFDNCPVTGVDWNDARAFCYWLHWRTNEYVCLPTEPEWEKAARGQANIYPWGNHLVATKLQPIGYEKHQPIGKYSPETDSPYGCVDMVTNVAELCNTLRHRGVMSFYKYPYDMNDGRENCTAQSQRSLKCGALSDSQAMPAFLRAAFRNWIAPGSRLSGIGFRVIVTNSEKRWQMAFPDNEENTKMEIELNLHLIDKNLETKDLVGYDVIGVTVNLSGVYIRYDNQNEIINLIRF